MAFLSAYLATGLIGERCAAALRARVMTMATVRLVSVGVVPGGISTVHILSDAPLEPRAVSDAIALAGFGVEQSWLEQPERE